MYHSTCCMFMIFYLFISKHTLDVKIYNMYLTQFAFYRGKLSYLVCYCEISFFLLSTENSLANRVENIESLNLFNIRYMNCS